ncbi:MULTISPECIES: GGDEF domain-containing protein [unclassified Campylobacter]|uniref:GGDEF domain-containing protein n=1 Tax=unclassified Campylobacter TaxID=2593542 RepID=UPI001BD981AE|nr:MULTISPECIES: GGDEF domain-containing protein [unclassified Campylobacter]MBZ7976768.1 bacteriohemerythrin [Campylobacter sp. RM12637]MBZ7980491.1 bacteriohemerythrin [Campylobacter sp. RM12642]MBZ7982282.1 bacteriohemerythrin [Campylobacter sp. RM12640]MBZ7989452.1 bacteriohemerythrin [Campylobacter sp. RM12635]MBT0880018.1 bacteriohemerythrin [Campylobacter sp. 2018MI27]
MEIIFAWNKDYETNIDNVDKQHYYLVQLINELALKLSEKNLNKNELDEAFNGILNYAKEHFSEEEMLMQNVNIFSDFFQEHKLSHKMFIEQTKQLYDDVGDGTNKEAVKSLLEFLISWLAFHILGIDQNMAKQIELINQGLEAKEAYEIVVQNENKQTAPLVKALSNLLNVVVKKNSELLELKRNLELKVKEKTRELAATNQTLRSIALTDVLTNLPNRRHLFEVLEVILNEAKENSLITSGLMIDLDNFKEVNDTYGHEMGDKVLREFSQTIKETIRTDDVLARLGGDEFFVLLPNTDIDGAMLLAKTLLNVTRSLNIQVGNKLDDRWKSSISIGVATILPTTITNSNDFMKKTDLAVYAAKNAGKNCIKVYNEEILTK